MLRRLAIGALLVIWFLLIAGSCVAIMDEPAHGNPTPGCASRAEYRVLDVFMLPKTVAAIFDINGWKIGTPSSKTFARGYKPCWAPKRKKIVVTYDQKSHLSIRWAVRNR